MFSKHWFQCGLVVGVSLLAGGAVAASANNLYVTVSSDTAGVEAIVPVDDDFYVTTHGVCAQTSSRKSMYRLMRLGSWFRRLLGNSILASATRMPIMSKMRLERKMTQEAESMCLLRVS